MRKIIALSSICAMLLLSACQAGTQTPSPSPSPSVTPAQVTPSPSPTANPDTYVNATNKSATQSGWSTVKSFKHDMDGDGTSEVISLTTSAEKDGKGAIMLDDTQKWALEMKDGSEYFTLYSGNLTNGIPYFEVYQDVNIEKNYVRLIISSGTEFEVKDYEFTADKRGFKEVESPEVQNRLFSSMPYYE